MEAERERGEEGADHDGLLESILHLDVGDALPGAAPHGEDLRVWRNQKRPRLRWQLMTYGPEGCRHGATKHVRNKKEQHLRCCCC